MTRNLLLIISAFLVHTAAAAPAIPASPCSLPSDHKEIVIGCTDGCSCTSPTCVGPTLQEAAKDLFKDDGVSIRFVNNMSDVDSSLSQVDAVLSGGGHDFDPKYVQHLSKNDQDRLQTQFGRNANLKTITGSDKQPVLDDNGLPIKYPSRESDSQKSRDELEAKVLDRYLAPGSPYGDKPYLGICYGMQMLAARVGIPPIEDLPEQLAVTDTRMTTNTVHLNKDSALAPFLPSDSFDAVKNHHQAVDSDYLDMNKSDFPGVRITGTSHGGKLPEVLEVGKNALGVQFHSEATQDKAVHLAPFKWLLTKACQNINKQADTTGRSASAATAPFNTTSVP